jgi:hypothetical protein
VEQLFHVRALVTQTGTYFVSVYLADIVFRPSPIKVEVIPGLTCASTVTLNQMELKNAVALSSSSFSIFAKDSFGNSKSLGGESSLFNISMKKVDEQFAHNPVHLGSKQFSLY